MRINGAAIVLGTVLIALVTTAEAADQAAGKGAAKPAAAAAKPASAQSLVAKVNGVGISQAEFTRNWEYFLQRSGIPADHAEKNGKVEEFRQQVLDRLVDEELLFQDSKNRKLLAGKEAVDAEIEKAHQQFPTPEAFTEALASNELTEAGLRTVLTRNLSIQNLVEKDIAKAVAVTEAEVHDFYAGNKEKFETPEQVHARHILVKVDGKADATTRQAAKAKAENLLAQLKGGGSFEELAKKESDCPSASQGGDLGFFRRGQMVPPFDQAVFALKPGELSGIVESEFGYHIIRLEEKKDAGTVAEADAAPRIREYLLAQKTEAAVEERLKALRGKAKIDLLMKF